jgi:hypothetical protein
VKETQLQMSLPGVPRAKQGREVAQKWDWTEASVWTERMLATLERGIKGGKWFSLLDKVWKCKRRPKSAAFTRWFELGHRLRQDSIHEPIERSVPFGPQDP